MNRVSTFAAGLVLSIGVVVAQGPDPRPKILVISGANNHDHRFTLREIQKVYGECGRFRVDTTTDPKVALEDAQNAARYACFVLDYNGPRWGEPAEANFVEAVRKGAGVVVIHAANNSFPGWVEYETMTGLGWRKGTGHGRFHPFDVVVVDRFHPVTSGMRDIRMHPDELYHRLEHLHGVDLRVLMSAYSAPETGGTGRHEPMVVTLSYGEGRVFHTTLGHVWVGVPQSRASWADPQFRRLLCRGTEWAATGAVTLSPMPLNWIPPEEKELGFRSLFDGKDLSGWRGFRIAAVPQKGWRVDDGTIFHEPGGGGGDLITFDQFGDFDLRFEWKVAENGNSGVIYRVTEDKGATYETGPEFQVLDDLGQKVGPNQSIGAGGLYDIQILGGKQVRPAGEWNEGRIRVVGWHIQHWLNGRKVVDLDLASDAGRAALEASKFKDWDRFAKNPKGHIALQDHGDGVWYRNLRIRRLDAEPK